MMIDIQHGIHCYCLLCNKSRYIEGVHCTSCMGQIIEVEATSQCYECWRKYFDENMLRADLID